MRKGTGSLQISPRRLLSLLLLHIIAALADQQVHGSPTPYSSKSASKSNWQTYDLSPESVFEKEHKMRSRCSNRYVQLKPGKKINARGTEWSFYATLRIISDPSGGVRIKGVVSNRYLCFSKKARLIAKSGGKSKRCLFNEEYFNGFVQLRSLVQPEWYVGFSPSGRKLYGYEHKYPRRTKKFGRKYRRRRFQECFLFTKMGKKRRKRRHINEENLEVLRRGSSKDLDR